jgi:TatD DNase family protein
MEFVDSHCHLQFDDYEDVSKVINQAKVVGVSRLICVGTSLADSQNAVDIAAAHEGVWASVGSHPHEASAFLADPQSPKILNKLSILPNVVAVGETGLDYYKNYSPRQEQKKALSLQIGAVSDSGLPFIFHIRDAWDDFWPIFDSFSGLRGVVHSFSAHQKQLEQILARGLYVGLNGIMTFTTDKMQLEAAKQVPLDRLLLETDAPFLTPKPFRGETCEPKHVKTVAEFLAGLRQEPLEELASATTSNAVKLFNLKADG